MMETKWCVLTGGPSSGITSLANYLRFEGYSVVPECARALIDLGQSFGKTTDETRADQVEFERQIIRLQAQVEQGLDPQKIIFIERGLPDVEAYGLPKKELEPFHLFRYAHVFMLEQVGFVNDYARPESFEEAKNLEIKMEKAYVEWGYTPKRLKKASIPERGTEILNCIGKTSHIDVSFFKEYLNL